MVYDIQWIMVVTDVPITAAITLSGISLVASHRVETDARVASVSASASTTVKCVQTLPPIRHNSEGCGWKKRKRRSGEEEIKYEDEENKLHNHRRPSIRSVGVDFHFGTIGLQNVVHLSK